MSMPLNRDNLTNAVIREIQAMILRGEIQPGDWMMPQPELASRLGVGLSTVREAIKGLTLIGIVEPQAGRGTWVHADAPALLRMLSLQRVRLTDLDLESVIEARRVLEVELTTLAAQRATEEDLASIASALNTMRHEENDAVFMGADLAFHLAVAHAAHNALLERFYHVTAQVMNEINTQIAPVPGVKDQGLTLQEDILEALRAHNPQEARQRATALIERWCGILGAVRAIDGKNGAAK